MNLRGLPSFRRPLAQGIRELGFRRWYERELLSSHAQLVLLLLCTVGFMGCLELMSSVGSLQRLLNGGYAIVCAVIGLLALRRYLFLMSRAEAIANQANCPSCGTYGRLEVVCEHAQDQRVDVRCRRCRAEWTIEE